jgi:flagellar hook-associated protein 2
MSTTSILNQVLAATTGNTSGGIDVTDAVAAILYADRAPERAAQAQQTTLAGQTTALNQLQTEASSLTDQLNALQDPTGALNSITAVSGDSSLFTATAFAGTAVGTHTVEVDQLASTGSAYSSEVASASTALTSGNFTITSGGTSHNITIGAGDTLNGVAASINNQSIGVNATVITDSTGSRLALVAQASGTAADFTVSAGTGLTFTQPAAADDSIIKVDGVEITSASNTVTGVIDGLTLNLQGSSPGAAVSLTLAPDAGAIEQSVSSFVTAYNTLISDVNSQFVYNSATGTSGALAADATARGLQEDLLGSANYSAGSGASQKTLASFGVTTNQDGTLSLNTTALATAVNSNSTAVQSFFQGTSSNGFVASVESTLSTYTDPTQGAFTLDLSSIKSENTDLTNQTSTLEVYLATQQTSLTTQYNNIDIQLEQLPEKLKQINALLDPNSSSGS